MPTLLIEAKDARTARLYAISEAVKHLSALLAAFKPSRHTQEIVTLGGMKPIYLFQALICGAVISFIDSRSAEVQAVALLILATTFIFGLLHARRAWAYATIIGLSIFITQAFTHLMGWPVSTNILNGLLALLPAFIGAYSGAGLRWVLDGLNETNATQQGQKKVS